MVDTNESKKAEALWQTLRLSFVSYKELLFLLFILCAVCRSIQLIQIKQCRYTATTVSLTPPIAEPIARSSSEAPSLRFTVSQDSGRPS